jgi:hypothetical protein
MGTRSNRVAIMGLFASLLTLIGCDKLGMSQVVYTTGADVPQILQAASAEGPLGVEAMGDGFGLDAAALGERVAAVLVANNPHPWLKFETDRAKSAGDYRMIFVFDARSVRQPDFPSICAGRAPKFERDTARFNVHAVVCTPRGPVVAVHGWMKRPESFDDPALQRLIIQIGSQAVRGAT